MKDYDEERAMGSLGHFMWDPEGIVAGNASWNSSLRLVPPADLRR